MIHRLGMYYIARQLQAAQDARTALRPGRRAVHRHAVPDHEELGMLARAGAVLAAAMATAALILWMAS